MSNESMKSGLILSLAAGMSAYYLGGLCPLAGSSIIALALGFIFNLRMDYKEKYRPGLKFSSKTLLKTGIILLGGTLNFNQVIKVGQVSVYIMAFTLFTAYASGVLFGKLFSLKWKMSTLISTGTGICGGSAIAALAPVIEADDTDISYSIAATFLFDIVMILAFPIAGRLLGLSDMGFGLWCGTAVNDTSSVVAAGYTFSRTAGEYATIVKLTRTLAIVPVVLVFSLASAFIKNKNHSVDNRSVGKAGHIFRIAPWFILAFLLLAGANSHGLIPVQAGPFLKALSRIMMATALFAIGFNTDIEKLKTSGARPMYLGFIVSVTVVFAALIAQFSLNIL